MSVMSRIVAAGQGLVDWVDERFPLVSTWKYHMSEYYAPKNFNFWYYFGSLAMIVLVLQIVTGIFLTMNYKPDASTAFGSVEYIMRDVSGGWIIRYILWQWIIARYFQPVSGSAPMCACELTEQLAVADI
jgi:quinol-cytochrome oxidoreductase complex cytochrome b subunit